MLKEAERFTGTPPEVTAFTPPAMAHDPEGVITALMEQNLTLVSRCATQPDVVIPEALRDQVRQTLV